MMYIVADCKFSMRHPIVIIGLLSLTLVTASTLIFGALYWWPMHSEKGQGQTELALLRKDIIHHTQKIELAKAYYHTKDAIIELENKLNAKNSQAALVGNLTRLAKLDKIKILSESYEEGREENGYIPLYQEIILQGKYPAIKRFLSDVQALKTWTVIREARLERVKKRNYIKAVLTLVTFRRLR